MSLLDQSKRRLASAKLELAILLGITAVFFLMGTWHRADVAK